MVLQERAKPLAGKIVTPIGIDAIGMQQPNHVVHIRHRGKKHARGTEQPVRGGEPAFGNGMCSSTSSHADDAVARYDRAPRWAGNAPRSQAGLARGR